jgi:hypothetical protein
MKRPMFVLLVVVVSALACLLSLKLHGKPRPREPIPFQVKDQRMKSVLVGEAASADRRANFIAENVRSTPLEVTYNGTSCGCVGVELKSRRLNRDDRVVIPAYSEIAFALVPRIPNMAGLHAYFAGFTVRYADGVDETLSVRATLPVFNEIMFSEEVISHVFKSGETNPIHKTVKVTRRSRSERRPAEARPRFNNLPTWINVQDVRDRGVNKEEQDLWSASWEVKLAVEPAKGIPTAPVPIPIAVTVDTDPASNDCAYLRLLCYRANGIQAPESVYFGAVQRGKKSVKRIYVRSVDEVPFKILKVINDSSEVLASEVEPKTAKTHWIYLNLCPKNHGTGEVKIVLLTDHPDGRHVPITGTYQLLTENQLILHK